MIKEREVAFLKVSSEPVFVLAFADPSPKIGDKELMVQVRRCNMSQNGTTYVTEKYFYDELESREDLRKRIKAESQDSFGGIPKTTDETPTFSA